MRALSTAVTIVTILAAIGCSWTERVSKHSSGAQGLRDSQWPTISGDGRYIAFQSDAVFSAGAPQGGRTAVYIHDTVEKTTEVVSVGRNGSIANDWAHTPRISADGRHVAFLSIATNIIFNDENKIDIFVRDHVAGKTIRATVNNAGNGANAHCGGTPFSLSADGRYIVFACEATNLDPRDTNNNSDVFLHDSLLKTTQLIGVTTAGVHPPHGSDSHPHISADGRYIVFQSSAQLAPEDTNWYTDVFLRDMVAGTTELISVSTTGTTGNGDSTGGRISDDGRYVMFGSAASNLVANDTNALRDVFYRDRVTGVTSRASVDSAGNQANGNTFGTSLSGDGRYVLLNSDADNLVAQDTNGRSDIFVRDMLRGDTRRISLAADGTQANESSFRGQISADGRYAVFDSYADNLVSGDTNGVSDIFVRAVPLPKVASVSPSLLPIGVTTAITVTGTDFLSGTDIAVIDAEISNMQVISETTIVADVTVSAGESSGMRDLIVAVPGTGAGVGTGTSGLCIGCLTFY